MNMEVLGEILHFSKSGRLIIKCENRHLKIRTGLIVADEKNRKLGKVSELIGPINSPYISLIPFVQKKDKINGMKVFSYNQSSHKYNQRSKIKRNKK